VAVAVLGMALVAPLSYAAALNVPTVRVSVSPRAGSRRTHFRVSFYAAPLSPGAAERRYKITAADSAHGSCKSSATATTRSSAGGTTIRVTLGPGRSRDWCAGTYKGQVWATDTSVGCGIACPAIVPAPELIGKFSFRVKRTG
jgi:hypothetical protein